VVNAATAGAPPRYRIENIPAELKAIPRWVVFQIVRTSKDKTEKNPLIAGITGKAHAKSNDPRTLRPFGVALQDANVRGLYLGFAFDKTIPYFFIDADGVVQPDGTIRTDIALLRDTLDTYTEYSVRGLGLHIIGKGAFPPYCVTRPVPTGCAPLERYPLHGGRFCIFTGNVLQGYETIEERSAELAALFPARERRANGSTSSAGHQSPVGDLTDDEIAAVASWADPLWTDGRRHHMALYLSGELARQGVSREQAAGIIEWCAVDDSDPGAKVAACHDTYDDLEAGETVSGWYGLKDVCGISEGDLAPLDAILDGFRRRHRPRILRVTRRPQLQVREVRHA